MKLNRFKLSAVLAALAACALMAPAAQAAVPAPPYSGFAGCPSPAENPIVKVCVRATVKSGNFKMGNKNVPITKPIVMTGGAEEGLFNFSANSEGGLKPAKQLVPGGVIGLTGLDWLVNFLSIEALQLYAVTELAGQPAMSFAAVDLPIKVHLINPALGNNCYVGSVSNPIKLHLIYGTTSPPPPNKPISGVEPTLTFEPTNQIFELNNGKWVDNSFSAPGASGCVLTLFGFIPISINGLVNTASGLPAAAGTNETVQNMDVQFVESALVYP